MKERFVLRARGLEPPAFTHPALASVLAATHGIPLYEEDVMAIAAAVAGLDLSAADSLRRAIAAATDPAERREIENGFVARAVAAGVAPDRALAVWEEIARFAAYSFSRAHASGYGVLAYQSAWLKAHHPAEFACAVLNHHQGMYPRWLHVEDARRHGVAIALPCLNTSAAEFTLERPAGERRRVRTGLGQVLGLTTATIEHILAARAADGPFASLADFRHRVELRIPELRALIAAGAADALGASRSALLFELYAARARTGPKPDGPGLFPLSAGAGPGPPLRELPPARQLRDEWLSMALSPRAHPLRILAPAWTRGLDALDAPRPRAAHPRAIGAGALASSIGERVAVAGLVAATRRTPTRNGESMAFVTLDDPTGTAELTLFPAALGRARGVLSDRGPLRAVGRPEAHHGAVSLIVERLEPLAGPKHSWSPIRRQAAHPNRPPARP
jgi:DNA polymerase III alpha subunit